MRLLHLHSGNLYGGVETLMLTLAREHHRAPSMEPEFALAFDGRLAQQLRAAGVPVHLIGQVRARNPLSVWRARRRVSELIAQRNCGLAVCHMAWAQAVFGAPVRRAGIPLIFWMHDAARGRHWVERWAALTPPDLAICNSRFTASTLSKIYPHTQSEVLYCPLAIEPMEMPAAERIALRAELATDRDAVVIVQTSRMEPWKGHELLLQALERLRGEPGWVCWIAGRAQRAGEREHLAALQRTARALGIAERVKFLGHRTDVQRLLAAADIFCQPNLEPEPFGIAFIEALAAGLPVVSTAMGGAREIIDETCGILVGAADASALAAALARLIASPDERARLAAAGPARAAALCDPGARMRQLETLVVRTAAAGRRVKNPAVAVVAADE